MNFSKIRVTSRILLSVKNLARSRSTTTAVQPDNTKVTTVDQEEVLKHVRLAEGWWDEQGDMKPLHSMNKLRIQFVRDGMLYTKAAKESSAETPHPLAGLKILDVGCGGGILSEPLARIGAEVTGIDPGQKLIDVARYHADEDPELSGKITYLCQDIQDHAADNAEKYDAVVASEVIEHVQSKEKFVESCSSVLKCGNQTGIMSPPGGWAFSRVEERVEMYRGEMAAHGKYRVSRESMARMVNVTAKKPGGSIFFTTINRTTEAWITAVMTAEYLLHMVPKDTHDWEKFITPLELQYMCEKYDCYTKLVHGMLYNIVNNEWYWVQNAVVNYALHAVKKK